MIAQLTGTLLEVAPPFVVLDVGGVGYELGVSAQALSSLPAAGSSGVTLLTRLVVREGAVDLFGFVGREERALFDRLVAISGVGPKLALSVLSTFVPSALATVVATQDANRMAQVPGVGKRKAQRLLVELQGVFENDVELQSLKGLPLPGAISADVGTPSAESIEAEVESALLSMGFTQREASLALEGRERAGAESVEAAIAFALRRLGGGV